MKIFYLANAYPRPEKPYYGIFIKEQYEYLRNNFGIETKLFVLEGENFFKKYIKPAFKLYRIIKNFQPDIIHIHYGLSGIPILLIYPLIKKQRIICTFHGTDINYGGIVTLFSKLLTFITTRNIAVSKEIFSKLKRNAVHIPCGVDPFFPLISKIQSRENKIIFPADPKRHVKNYSLFLDVVSILRNKLNFEIVLFDKKTRNEVRDALISSKCMVLTSLSEGSPQVVKEAIICNLPVVATPVGDVPELIEGLPGCCIAHNAEEMANAVKKVMLNPIIPFPYERKFKLTNQYICTKIMQLYLEIAETEI